MSRGNVDTASRIRVGKYQAVLPPGHRDSAMTAVAWRVIAPFIRRSQKARKFFYELPRSRVRTALVVRYYRDILDDVTRGDISRHLRAIAPDAPVTLFGMEEFRGPRGAEEAVTQWRQSFPGLQYEMSELITPDGSHVLCIGRLMGGGAVSGADVMQQVVLRIKVVDGTAVELTFSNDRAEALEAVGLRE